MATARKEVFTWEVGWMHQAVVRRWWRAGAYVEDGNSWRVELDVGHMVQEASWKAAEGGTVEFRNGGTMGALL